jgi:hypothetical protein
LVKSNAPADLVLLDRLNLLGGPLFEHLLRLPNGLTANLKRFGGLRVTQSGIFCFFFAVYGLSIFRHPLWSIRPVLPSNAAAADLTSEPREVANINAAPQVQIGDPQLP